MTGEPPSQLAWADPPWRISGRTLTAWFEIDREREKFLMTFNPGGFLRKIA